MTDRSSAGRPRRQSFARRRAITLVELTLVLALAAIVVFVAVRAYSQAQANSRNQQTITTVALIKGVVGTQYSVTSSFAGLSTSNILTAVPKSLVSGATIVNPFSGTASVGPDTYIAANDSFYVAITNVPLSSCLRIAIQDQGRSAVAMKVDPANGGGAVANAASTPMTVAQAQAACTGTVNSIAWQMQ